MSAALVVALGAISMVLQGCTFGSTGEMCDGEGCSCSLTFHSFWARIRISGVPIEHVGRDFYIPDVARDVPNASSAPCCSAIFDQIDYDEGKTADMPNKTVQSFSNSCSASPNKQVASAASGKSVIAVNVTARRLRKTDSQPVARQGKDLQVGSKPWIDDGQVGQDCVVSSSGGFPLNNVLISSGSMKLRVKWADPENGATPCCDALQPILENVYLKHMPESALSSETKSNFCSQCKSSPNQGIALAAYRCFGDTVV